MTRTELERIAAHPYPIRTIRHGSKHVVCPVCERAWDVGRKGGGMVVGAAMRHVEACAKKHLKEAADD